MSELISETMRKAIKIHQDDCYEWIENGDFTGLLSFSERRAIINARNRNWKILPGMVYCNQTVKYEGKLHTFRSMPDLIEICRRAKVWDNI